MRSGLRKIMRAVLSLDSAEEKIGKEQTVMLRLQDADCAAMRRAQERLSLAQQHYTAAQEKLVEAVCARNEDLPDVG